MKTTIVTCFNTYQLRYYMFYLQKVLMDCGIPVVRYNDRKKEITFSNTKFRFITYKNEQAKTGYRNIITSEELVEKIVPKIVKTILDEK